MVKRRPVDPMPYVRIPVLPQYELEMYYLARLQKLFAFTRYKKLLSYLNFIPKARAELRKRGTDPDKLWLEEGNITFLRVTVDGKTVEELPELQKWRSLKARDAR